MITLPKHNQSDFYTWHAGTGEWPGFKRDCKVRVRVWKPGNSFDWLEAMASEIDWSAVQEWCRIPDWYLPKGTQVLVRKPWWLKQVDVILCEVYSQYFDQLTVKPLSGNPHTRSVNVKDCDLVN